MKLLICTQKVDQNDSFLGFMIEWLQEFSKRADKITVICLEKGKYKLPSNVEVLSLGKESGVSRLKYVYNFFRFILSKSKNYDSVFVHMNQEYVLLGAIPWKVLSKNIFLWRNHHSGNRLTDLAAKLSTKVFCTSKYSYTAKYKNTVIMPVGVDLNRFAGSNKERPKNSVLFLGRISPSKNVHVFLKAIRILNERGIQLEASVVGDCLEENRDYFDSLDKSVAKFYPGVPHSKTSEIYEKNNIYVNLSSSGMYDKTIFEAMASGCLVLASNDNLKGEIDDAFILTREPEAVANSIEKILALSAEEQEAHRARELELAMKNSLDSLGNRLKREMEGVGKNHDYLLVIRFLLVGGLSVLTNLVLLYLLTDILAIYYLYSAVVSFIGGSFVSFILQKNWTFNDKERVGTSRKLLLYYSLALFNLCIHTILMYLLVSTIGIHHLIAATITTTLIATISLLVYKKIFKNVQI